MKCVINCWNSEKSDPFFIFAFSFYFSYFKVVDYYSYSQELVQEANIINSLTDSNDLIVTDRTGDTTLLYLSDRRGAPSIFRDPIDLKKLGYKYLITSSEGEINIMKPDFKIVFENEKFTLFLLWSFCFAQDKKHMKILMVTPYVPYPPSSGGQIRTYNLLKYLSQNNEITLVALYKNNEEKKYESYLKKYCRKI